MKIINELDIHLLKGHSKDGLDGFLFCFINNNIDNILFRQKNLDVVFDLFENDEYYSISNLNNVYVIIYVTTFEENNELIEISKEIMDNIHNEESIHYKKGLKK